MPKAALQFQLPEESDEHYLADHGSEYWSAINEFDQRMGSMIKDGSERDEMLCERTLAYVRAELLKTLEERQLRTEFS